MTTTKDQVLKRAKVALDNMVEKARNQRNEEDRKFLVSKIGEDLAVILVPLLEEIAINARMSKEDISGLVNQIKTEIAKVQIEIPEIKMPDIFVPEPKVTVNVPDIIVPQIKIPDIKMPDEMNIKGWVGLMGVSLEKPLPVQLRNPDGSPFSMAENLNVFGSSGGGSRGIVKISGYDASAWANLGIINGDGRLKVETNDSGGSTTEVRQVSGAVDSVIVNDVLVTVGVNQVSGANWSVSATQVTSPWVVSATDLDVRDLNVTQDEVLVHQVSGSSWSTEATQAGTWNIGTVTTVSTVTAVTDVTNSIRVLALPETLQTQLADITTSVQTLDNAISGSEMQVDVLTMPTVTVTGTLTSVVATGAVLHDAADDGHAPVKIGAHAIQTNPTAVADGDIARIVTDDIGRTVTRPMQVRDLIVTAYVSVTSGTEATLLAASAGSFHDLIMVVGSNNSDAAVSVDIRAVTAGNIVNTLRIPANGTAGWAPAVPWPQDATGNNWTVDGPDETGRTLTFSALFSREV